MRDATWNRFIYFIRPIGWDSPIKIGCSIRPETRLAALMQWSPFPLEILATAPGGTNDERRLHQRFAADRLRAEWFRTTRELIDLIDSVAKTGALPFEIVGSHQGKLPGLRSVLKRHGISTKQLAKAAGVSPSSVTGWATNPNSGGSARVIEALQSISVECSLADLLETSA